MDENTIAGASEKQSDLVRRYCADAEQQIATASSYAEAAKMRDSLCARFESECDSPLVIHATRQYLDSLIRDRWKGRDTPGREILIEDLISTYPEAVKFMIAHGLPCFVCGEPLWGTFEEMARRSGKTEPEIDALVDGLRVLTHQGRQ